MKQSELSKLIDRAGFVFSRQEDLYDSDRDFFSPPGIFESVDVTLVTGDKLQLAENESAWVIGYYPMGVFIEVGTLAGDEDFKPTKHIFFPYSQIKSIERNVGEGE